MGAAGSGKTTLAQKLAGTIAAPWCELDTVGYEGGSGAKRSAEQRLADLRTITAQPAWVTEGSYLWWIEPLLETADAIVWLDLPWHISLRRIITRHIELSLAGTNRHPGVGKLIRFVWGCHTYYTDKTPCAPTDSQDDGAINRVTVVRTLAAYSHKLVHCTRPGHVDAFVVNMQRSTAPRLGSDISTLENP